MSRKVPDINASSMADISFLLLIFFLVATTMNVDSGIQRTLPQWPDENQKQEQEVKKRNMLLVFVNPQDQVMINYKVVEIYQIKDIVKEFVLNPTNDPEKPEKKIVDIDIIGKYPVSEGIVSLQNEKGTSYDAYIKVQNELTRAFNEIRESLSNQKFGKKYANLDEPQSKAIQKAVPTKISEADPRDITSGK